MTDKIIDEKAQALSALEQQTEAYKNLADFLNKILEGGNGKLDNHSSKLLSAYIEKHFKVLSIFDSNLTPSIIFNQVTQGVEKVEREVKNNG
ncbi:hypothetical protein EFE32_08105 [Lactococcus lactis subsp. lactis]|uniref:hypothetical protein n=1 Tax=Lactococcus lactis TaxID=1358 RepID=UPI00223C33B3|nr:hypothetical protein [Lactococcus lactis]MCT0016803.1 hypothetical protein [Lactococcus lactis subsp. lactis]